MQLSKRTAGALVALLTISLVTVACDTLDYLQLAIGAAEIAIPLIPIGDPAVKTLVENYLAAASDAVTKVTDIEAGTGTAAQKAVAISAALAGVIAAVPNIPPQYQALANAVAQVAAYLAKFLAAQPVPAPTAASAAIAKPMSTKEKAKLATIRIHAQQVYQKMHH